MISNIENKLIKISRMAWIIAIFFSVLMLVPFFEDNPISKIWAIAFISLYFALTSIVVALMYLVKSNKFNKLISNIQFDIGFIFNIIGIPFLISTKYSLPITVLVFFDKLKIK